MLLGGQAAQWINTLEEPSWVCEMESNVEDNKVGNQAKFLTNEAYPSTLYRVANEKYSLGTRQRNCITGWSLN